MWAFTGHAGAVVVGCDSSGESQNAVVEATREVSRRGTGGRDGGIQDGNVVGSRTRRATT